MYLIYIERLTIPLSSSTTDFLISECLTVESVGGIGAPDTALTKDSKNRDLNFELQRHGAANFDRRPNHVLLWSYLRWPLSVL